MLHYHARIKVEIARGTLSHNSIQKSVDALSDELKKLKFQIEKENNWGKQEEATASKLVKCVSLLEHVISSPLGKPSSFRTEVAISLLEGFTTAGGFPMLQVFILFSCT